ncbi:hypothetical protein [Roseateles noduli]|uniref:hypothetical protein n=1 Tax=Roseateles noduli TaxID=2052484 RepID=UPI003D65FAF8
MGADCAEFSLFDDRPDAEIVMALADLLQVATEWFLPQVKQERFEEIRDNCEGMELDAVWAHLEEEGGSYEERKRLFFHVLKRLLEEGDVKLVVLFTDTPLPGDVDQQVMSIVKALPETEDALQRGLWFLGTECPGGSAWTPRRGDRG